MGYFLLKKSDQKSQNWSGGTTTQLYISPENSSFPAFDFNFRISTATVEVESTDFTFMPGVTRHLMILEGNLWLEHIERSEHNLNIFDQTIFNGEWPTRAKGKVRDFNLLLRNNAEGSLEHVSIKKQNDYSCATKNGDYSIGVYVCRGNISIPSIEKVQTLAESDFLFITTFDSEVLQIHAIDDCELILVRVKN